MKSNWLKIKDYLVDLNNFSVIGTTFGTPQSRGVPTGYIDLYLKNGKEFNIYFEDIEERDKEFDKLEKQLLKKED
jgi:hypothetical protein